jgi:6-pyruvoyltetrahydropterin/6-carboxytetrahydropterin synthase
VSVLELTRQYRFSAGHRLENPALSSHENERVYGQCYRQHGHNYRIEVTVAGEMDPITGMAADLGALDAAVKRVILDRVDHYDLSSTVDALRGVPTTGENLACAFWKWLEPTLPAGSLRRLVVIETDNNTFEYRGAAAR